VFTGKLKITHDLRSDVGRSMKSMKAERKINFLVEPFWVRFNKNLFFGKSLLFAHRRWEENRKGQAYQGHIQLLKNQRRISWIYSRTSDLYLSIRQEWKALKVGS
jgi:hypothetical protein